ncbi:MAG TPA: hypothetical protein VFB58_11510 [Chloroflexota bacterium]|nr:hypothetical protein [Chloroflexota bacterium]
MAEERSRGVPSNPVYERVGEDVKLTAHAGVRRGLTPQDIIRQIAEEHHVHLNVGELRLLLAGRRVEDPSDSDASSQS